MISFEEAFQKVMDNPLDLGNEKIHLDQCMGRILAETIIADRDFPPFDRATKDGIAIRFDALKSSEQEFKVVGVAQAGSPQLTLEGDSNCIEIMTGAMVPKNADTVVMYEHTNRKGDIFTIHKTVNKGQDIHYQASDIAKNGALLQEGTKITPAEIGVLASVGKSEVLVKKSPKVAVVSTGNELVDVHEIPEPYQIRKSNSHTLMALLEKEHVKASLFHLVDEPNAIKETLKKLLGQFDVLLLSGGVSKGKYDFLPEVFDSLGVEKVFHRVLQRPGKPFWFGRHAGHHSIVFSFPGNPVSTFVNYHTYFKPWLNKTLGTDTPHFTVILEEALTNQTDLSIFVGVAVKFKESGLYAKSLSTSGSGDLASLAQVDGFIQLGPYEEAKKGINVPFIPTRSII
ncbi:MAG: molybdopterin molybdotransferase MoeA [Allomuricauda sp.]